MDLLNMKHLNEKNCTVCRLGSPQLTEVEMQAALLQLPSWAVEVSAGVKQLVRTYPFKNFVDAMAFTVAVGNLAEAHGHHPALVTEWGRVIVRWWTHKIKGLHENDVIMAAKTEQLFSADFPH